MQISDTFSEKNTQKGRFSLLLKIQFFCFFFPVSYAPPFRALRLTPKVWVTQPPPANEPLTPPQVVDPMQTYG